MVITATLNLIEKMLVFSSLLLQSMMVLIIPLTFLLLVTFVLMYFSFKLVIRFVPKGDPNNMNVAFFHPYCNAGGGGERVLWIAIKALQSRHPNVECYVYTGDTESTPEDILLNVRLRFNINLPKEPTFIYLQMRKCVEAKYYPFFTLLGQSLGSMVLGMEAIARFNPDVYIDTMGYSFTYPLFRFLCNSKIGCYVHYPTISSDMLDRVGDHTEAHNNRSFIANSLLLSSLKLGYYHSFAVLYSLAGKCADVVMVNSSWTKGHITSLWGMEDGVRVVHPPCDTFFFSNMKLIDDSEKPIKTIVSIGQFRPEKNYPLQLRSFKKLLTLLDEETAKLVKLVLIGGVRNREDEERVEELKKLASDLGIEDQVVWNVNAPFMTLVIEVQKGTIGLHAMWNEHFGISVVECMAGGLIMVAHNSGGPKMDIVKPYQGQRTGFLASTEEEYALMMKEILDMTPVARLRIINSARLNAASFSESNFEEKFLTSVQRFF